MRLVDTVAALTPEPFAGMPAIRHPGHMDTDHVGSDHPATLAEGADHVARQERPSWSGMVSRPLVLGAAAVLPALAAALLAVWRDQVATATVALVLVLLVVAAASTGDRIAGVIAAFSGALWFDFFFAPPYQQLTISDPDDVEVTVLLVLISLAVTEVALWGRQQQAKAARRSGYLDGVVSTAGAVAAGDSPVPVLLDVVSRQIVNVLGADRCQFIAGPVRESARVAVFDHDGAVARDGKPIDVDRHGLPVDDYVAIPVRRGPRTVGHFLITAATGITYPTREQRRVAVLLADQVAAALDPSDHSPGA